MAMTPDQNQVMQAVQSTVDLGSLVANATIGVQRNPDLPLGTHIVEILGTQKPQIGTAFVADLKMEQSTDPNANKGGWYRWYRGLSGSPKAVAAGLSETLAFICAAAGFRNLAEFEAAGFDKAKRARFINLCLGVGPGPLEGQKIQITVTDSGRVTRPKTHPDGTVYPGGHMIRDYAFAPVEDKKKDEEAAE